jgi:menaquinone-specific isochorismate synthase
MAVTYDIPIASNLIEATQIARNWVADKRGEGPGDSRLVIKLPTLDILAIIGAAGFDHSVYWSDRVGQFEFGGIGVAHKVSYRSDESGDEFLIRLQNEVESLPDKAIMLGGLAFNRIDHSRSGETNPWRDIDRSEFILPLLEFRRTESNFVMAVNLRRENDRDQLLLILNQLSDFAALSHTATAEWPLSFHRTNFPEFDNWRDRIENGLAMIDSGRLEKLVLARQTVLGFEGRIEPFHLLSSLRERSPGCFHFCFKFANEKSFLGASPERLFSLDSRRVWSEALAGTRARGDSPESDRALEEELKNSDKDIREQRFVIDFVKNGMKKVCEQLQNGGEVKVQKLARVQHLVSTFEGQLKESKRAIDVLSALHPTPAVGGHPTKPAVDAIAELEQFDRGWYAGPVGWIGRDKAEFAVAIRSAMIDKNRLCLYSGAGIVAGSEPAAEWDEIESKISNFLNLFESK